MSSRAAALNLSYAQERVLIKRRLNLAFAAMRREGIMARQHFKCCGSCAGAQFARDVLAMSPANRAKFTGVCYYTKQEGQDQFNDTIAGRIAFGKLYIKYGPVHADGVDHGLPAVEVGQRVQAALLGAQLEVEWNGDGERTIVMTGLAEALEAAYRLGGHRAIGWTPEEWVFNRSPRRFR